MNSDPLRCPGVAFVIWLYDFLRIIEWTVTAWKN